MKFQNLSVKRLFGRVAIGLVLSMSGITIAPVSDTHLDVYKRQHVVMCKARCRMFRNELRSRYVGMVGSAVHDHIIIAAPHLADGACVHAPVWACLFYTSLPVPRTGADPPECR